MNERLQSQLAEITNRQAHISMRMERIIFCLQRESTEKEPDKEVLISLVAEMKQLQEALTLPDFSISSSNSNSTTPNSTTPNPTTPNPTTSSTTTTPTTSSTTTTTTNIPTPLPTPITTTNNTSNRSSITLSSEQPLSLN